MADNLQDVDRLTVRLTTGRSGADGFELAHYTWADRRIVAVYSIGTLPCTRLVDNT